MTKYIYTENFVFMLGEKTDEEVRLPYQDIKRVMDSIPYLQMYLFCIPLTNHPNLGGNCRIKSSSIIDMEEKEGFCEVTTKSGSIYRLITE